MRITHFYNMDMSLGLTPKLMAYQKSLNISR